VVYDVDGQVTAQTVTDPTGGDASRTVSSTYNGSGQVASTTDAAGKTIRFEYDAYGNMVKETDADGGVTMTAYDAEGRLLTSTLKDYTGDPNNPTPATDLVLASKAYDPAGRLASVTDAMGWVTSYTYTDNNLAAKTARTDPTSGATFVQEDNSYDPAGNLISRVTGDGATTTTYTVDAAGRTTSTTLDPAGLNRTTAYTLSPDDTVLATAVSDASGTVARSEATYDPLGRLASHTVYNDGGAKLVTRWDLDQGGLPRAVEDPIGRFTNISHDEAGRVTGSASPPVYVEPGTGASAVYTVTLTSIGYDTFGEQTEVQDQDGHTTVTEYDAAGRVSAVRLPGYIPPGSATVIRPVESRAYDSLGQLVTSTDPLGKQTAYSYDQLGRVARMTAPNGGQTNYTYDLVGDQLSETDPTGALSTATYDYLGRKVTSTDVVRQDNTNYTTEYSYGTGGWLTKTKSAAGVVTQATYNAAGEQVTVTDGANNVTRYTYDGLGRATRTTLPDGTYRTATYDLAGRQTAARSYDASGALLQTRTNGYDDNGNITTATDPRGTQTTFSYDGLNRLTDVVEPVSATDSIHSSFGYDAAGNRTRFTDGRGNPFLTTYNSWGLPESRTEPATGVYSSPADRTFTVTYDAAGRPAARTSPGGVTVSNTYDDMGNLTRQAGTGAEVTTADRVFGYDLAGRVTSAAGSAGTTTLSYDDRGLPRTIGGASGSSSFAYNPDGEVAARTDAAGTTNYTYDGAGRLSSAANPAAGVQLSYGYNSLSQVKTIGYGTSGNTRSFGYDGLHRVTGDELKNPAGATIARIAYGYDANGDETSKTTIGFSGSTTNTYTYDLADRLTSWSNGTTTTTYVYDKSGNRIQAGGKTFSYDERNQLRSASDGTTYRYTARGTLKASISGGATLSTKADAFDQVVSQDAAGNSQTYTYDGFGRVIRAGFAYTGLDNDLASDGTNSYTRDPSGDLLGVASGSAKTLAWTDLHDDVVGEFTATGGLLTGSAGYDPFGKVLASTGMVGSLGYQSEWTDPASGRVNMLARWYNPDTGQFDTRDAVDNNPVPDSIDANRFAYADDNPMTNTDPTGHWSLGGLIKKAKSVVSRGVQAIASTASTVWNVATSFVSTAWHAATSFVSNVYHAAVNYTAKKIDQGRKYVAHKAQQAKQIAKKAVAKAKQVGRVVVTKATRVVHETVNHVKDVYDATAKWVKEHKDLLIEVAAIAGGVLAGLACTAATAGAGAVACMVGAAALINLAKDAAQGHIHNWGDAFGSLGTGALQGLAGGVGGIVGGKIAALAVGRLGAFGASIAGRALAGGIAGGVGDAAAQYATTGHVNWGGVAMSAGIGAVFGAVSKGGATRAGAEAGEAATVSRGGGAARGEPAAPAKGRAEDTAVSCRSHSFDPNTRVLMADGSTKAIKDVAVTDKVATTDPKTGATEAKPVTALPVNQDRDLTDVTVKVAGAGAAAVLHTTQHHPFWDQTASRWVLAADLAAGHTLHTDGGRVATVVAVQNYVDGDGRDMRDLTVADVHTYYVLAGETPVLVHNCETADPKDLKPTHEIRGDASSKRVARYRNDMRNGEFDWEQSPISIVRNGDDMYVVDGHHRLAAARLAGLDEVSIRDVTAQLNEGGFAGYTDMDDVLRSAHSFTGNKLNPYKLR
jgi:RHS repeat-associated protein